MEKKDFRYSVLILHDDYLEFTWNELTAEMTEDEFKEIMLEYASFVEKYHPKRLLLDALENKFLLTPAIQEWTDKNIFKRTYDAGLRRNAYIYPKDFLAQMGVEQIFDEEIVRQKEHNFFYDREEALKWLLLK